MNIVAICMMKNEEDIAEIFCRYTLGFCDKLLVLEDNSDDLTPVVLDSLAEEGLPVIIVRYEFGTGFYKHEKINKLAREAFEQYGADLVVPLDADEFITTDKGEKIRATLEGLRGDCIYQFPWRTYVLTEKAIAATGSILERFDSIRPPEIETYYKIVVPRELFVRDGYTIQLGQHDLDPVPGSQPRERIISDDLIFAHFPIRGIAQATSKIIIGWLNYLSIPGGRAKSYHWPLMYESIKSAGGLSTEEAGRLSYYYSVLDDRAYAEEDWEKRVLHMPFNTEPAAEKGRLALKYTPEPAVDAIRVDLLLAHLEKMIEGFTIEKTSDAQEILSLKASNSWRVGRALTAPLRGIKKLLKS